MLFWVFWRRPYWTICVGSFHKVYIYSGYAPNHQIIFKTPRHHVHFLTMMILYPRNMGDFKILLRYSAICLFQKNITPAVMKMPKSWWFLDVFGYLDTPSTQTQKWCVKPPFTVDPFSICNMSGVFGGFRWICHFWIFLEHLPFSETGNQWPDSWSTQVVPGTFRFSSQPKPWGVRRYHGIYVLKS